MGSATPVRRSASARAASDEAPVSTSASSATPPPEQLARSVAIWALLFYCATQLVLSAQTHLGSEPRLRVRPQHASAKKSVPWAPLFTVSAADHDAIKASVKGLGSVYSDFRESHSTLFLLRIQKAGSSFLMGMVGTLPFEDPVKVIHNMSAPVCRHFADCDPWTLQHDPGLMPGAPECEDRKVRRVHRTAPPRFRPARLEASRA
jgi:hypothetical protein